MKKGKYAKRRGAASRVLVMLLAIVMIVGISVGGTLAWLSAKTTEVTNVFTDSGIDIKLEETTGNEYKMVPGATISKDPFTTVLAGSEACWHFVKIVEEGGIVTYKPDPNKNDTVTTKWSDFLTYAVAEGWNPLTDTDKDGKADDGVYWRKVDATKDDGTLASDVIYSVLKDNQVKVQPTVTKQMMDALTAETYPTLTFTAYATQLKNGETDFTVSQAWENAQSAVAPAATTEATTESTP